MTTMTQQVFWYYRQANQSPLVTQEFLTRQRRVLMPQQYAREHQNSWVDAADSFTSAAEVDAAMQSGWSEQYRGVSGCTYEHFWDLGSVKDPTVGGVGHVEVGIIHVDHLVTFQGSHESPVLLPVVKQAMLDLAQRFPPKRIRIESWQGLSAAQELKAEGLPVELFAPTAKAHAEEWPVLAQRLSSRTVRLFPHARLREELLNLSVELGPSGVKVIDKGRIHQDHAVVVRGIVAGLSGPMLPPFFFVSEGRVIGAAPVPSVLERLAHVGTALTQALTPTNAPPVRTIAEIESLDEGCREPHEQAQLDAHYAQEKRTHVPSDFEAYLASGGVWFPDDEIPRTGWNQVMQEITEKFSRWR
jgi:hypothetical protein